MGIFDRIVCGVDGSKAALDALGQARRLLAPGGRLVAVTVCELAVAAQAGWAAGDAAAQLERAAKQAADEVQRELEGLPNAEVRVVRGSPATALLAVVRREGAGLLAVGSHGGSRALGILLGGTTTSLLHVAPCSVLVARSSADSEGFPHSIVVGVDGSDESLLAADAAEELALCSGASLRFIAATGGKPIDLDGLARLRSPEPALARASGAPRRTMIQLPVLEWNARAPLEALLAASAEADLVVLGSRGLHGLAALGSISERVAHRASCSVLVARHAHPPSPPVPS